MAISDYNSSASLNTSISSINIAEGSPRANINDAFRQLMADIASIRESSGQFYAGSGAKIQRLRDRVFVGSAADNLGTNAGSQPDWLTTFDLAQGRTFGFIQLAQFAVLTDSANTQGGNAIVGGARTSTLTGVGGVVGVLGVAINNNSTYSCGAWGAYFEGYQQSGSLGPAYGGEINTRNINALADSTAYSQAATQVVGLQIASGAEYPSGGQFAASAGLAFRNNGSTFAKGIIFGNDSLAGTTGNGTGVGIAMQMACGHGFQWLTPSATIATQIFGNSTTTAGSTTVSFAEGSTIFSNSSSGKTLLQLATGSSYVNFLNLIPAVTTSPPQISAAGDDTNIDLFLAGKGTGLVRFGTWTTNADAPVTGYVTIKDAGGTTRKLATIA